MYPALLRVYWQRALVYRAVYAVLLVNSVFPLVMMFIWMSLAQSSPIQGYSAPDFVAYYLLAILVRRITSCGIVRDIEALVRSGELSAYLLRPLSVAHYFVAWTLTARLVVIPVVALPLAVGLVLTPGIRLDLNLVNLALFALACVVGLAFEFVAQFAIAGLSFWITQAHGINAAFLLAKGFLGGYIVPLALFPVGVQAILRVLPFQSGIALPVGILMGRITPNDGLFLILVCAAWVAVTALCADLVWRSGLRSYSAVGA